LLDWRWILARRGSAHLLSPPAFSQQLSQFNVQPGGGVPQLGQKVSFPGGPVGQQISQGSGVLF
jgi:hypothetical protein